jgi:hypothetical protein
MDYSGDALCSGRRGSSAHLRARTQRTGPLRKAFFALTAMGLFAFGSAAPSFGQAFLDFGNGLALPGYNDVQVPRDTGTRFSLTEDLKTDAAYFFRIRLGIQWKDRHTISVLAAPFRLHAVGSVGREIVFFEETFGPGTPLSGLYRFDSYRLTYRYDFVRRGKWRVGFGLTAKIRDAAIRLEGGGRSSTKTNVGFVPLVNFRVLWQFHPKWGLLFEGDAAAAKQGRAEDVILALRYHLNSRLSARVGYRILEGGANVEEVYNFALVHYLSVGVTYSFW